MTLLQSVEAVRNIRAKARAARTLQPIVNPEIPDPPVPGRRFRWTTSEALVQAMISGSARDLWRATLQINAAEGRLGIRIVRPEE